MHILLYFNPISMDTIYIIAIVLFVLITFLFIKLSDNEIKRKTNATEWRLWGLRTHYYRGIIIVAD